MRNQTSFIQALLLLASPPLIWFVHLSALYAVHTIACTVAIQPMVANLTITGLAAVLLTVSWRLTASTSAPTRIVDWSRALWLLSALAIAWTTLALLLSSSACGAN
jgi:hypothetical protein